jgi:hypothetical protein
VTRSELAELITQRLRVALNVELAVLCERERVDMSREAITHRVRDLTDMSTLCLVLGHPIIEPR